MKKLFTLLALTISFSMNAQMSDNSSHTSATGTNAVAMGRNTTASGAYSTAMGLSTTASGSTSTAMGQFTTASGTRSTAMGQSTTASGNYSTAMGQSTTASDYASLVIGQYNSSGSSVTTSASSFSTSNTAFVIGNGTAAYAPFKSDAFKVMFNGDTYISSTLYIGGTAITASAAEINLLDGVTATAAEINLLDGVTAVGSGILSSVTENSNTGVRLSTSNSANHGDIGSNAVDLSYSASSSSTYGATGNYSIAMGYQTQASGTYSTAMGVNTTASGNYSTAMGYQTQASGNDSTAMGTNTTASGGVSTAMGFGTATQDYASTAIGAYNKTKETPNPSEFSLQNTAFVIGNGTDESRSNAFEVLFDGSTTIAGDLNINSDARLKANIISLGATLSKLLQIDGKSYTMKKDENKKQKIGVLAQDIEKVFPELVSESNGVKSVNYQGLVPVLINALKEQDSKMKEQDNKMNEQEARIERLEKLLLDS